MSSPPTFSEARPRIAVIGGGITGLAAAHRLHELLPRADLALFEAGPRLGGVIQTIELEGFLAERSADNFLTKEPAALELCRRLGLADELLPTSENRRRAFVVRCGSLLPIPEGFYLMAPRKLWTFLKSPTLSLRGKLRLLIEPLIPHRRFRHSAAADESVASFARRRLGCEAFERLIQPLVAGIYTADPEKLSMAATMPEFYSAEHNHQSILRAIRRAERFSESSAGDAARTATGARYSLFVAPRRGMRSLIDALASRLPAQTIHLDTRVTGVQPTLDGQWHVQVSEARRQMAEDLVTATGEAAPDFRSRSASGHSPSSFDALLLAAPAHAAARLLEAFDPVVARELAAIEYAGCAVISFGFARHQIGHPLDGFGLVVPVVERRRIIAASFASQKFPGRAPAESVLIRVFMGGALQPELLELSDEDLHQLALGELRDLLGIVGQPAVTDIARWPHSMPQYHVGHLDRVTRIEQLVARHPRLALAGNAYRGVGIPQCIASAEAAAERLAERVRVT